MNRTILVTGGNRGIGLAAVKALAQNKDNKVLLGCRDLSQGEEEAKGLGENVIAVHLDLSTKEGLNKNLEKIISTYPEIYGLINNAGIIEQASFDELSDSDFEKILQVNFKACYQMIRKIYPLMIAQGRGRIVNVSSGWGSHHEGLGGPFSYALTKASLNALTATIAKQLPSGITINAICPGWVHTRMGGEDAPRTPEQGADSAVWLMESEESPNGKFFRDRREISY